MGILSRLLGQVFARPTPPPEPQQAEQDSSARAIERVRALIKERDFEQALAGVGDLLASDPDHVDALVLSGEILRRRRSVEDAKLAYRRALVLAPGRHDAWLDLGTCYYLEGDYFWARFYYRHAVALAPDDADVWNELGLVEILLGNYEKASESLNNAVNIEPEHAEAWNNLGLIAARRGDLAAARGHFLRATFIRPDYHVALVNLGIAHCNLEALEEAGQTLRRALASRPQATDALLALARVSQEGGDLEGAGALLERARQGAPQDAAVLAALSDLGLRRGDGEGAQSAARAALRADPEHADAELALAHALLAHEGFGEGWEHYEARLRANPGIARITPFPRWQGEPLAGRSIYIHGEQGIGDEIMFASCLPDLVASGAQCVVECQPRLRALFRRSFPSIRVIDHARELRGAQGESPALDYASPIGSLPRFLRRRAADFPGTPYLTADSGKSAHWAARLKALGPGMKVGIAWRGGLLRTGRSQRSLTLADLGGLLGLPQLQWVSLQHRYRADSESAEPGAADAPLAVWPEALSDMDEMAALVNALDLVVTMCSSLVHLCGALGRPAWVLTPYAPPWRYLRSGQSMPWYGSVRLYRQDRASDWSEPLAAVARDLQHLAQQAAAIPCH